jgi:hypothetical protein
MSFESAIKKLNNIASEAKALFDELIGLTSGEANENQKSKIKDLADRLNTDAAEASRERRTTEIRQLTEIINVHELTLSVPGLPSDARETIRADLIAKKTRRARLLNQAGTDFDGILTKSEVREIVKLVEKAQREVQQKKFAAEFLSTAIQIGDMAVSLAGKFFLPL